MSEEKIFEINFDLLCKPGPDSDHPSYRVFVDGDLLTERSFVWNSMENYIQELVIVKLSPGRHSLKVQPLVDPYNRIVVERLTINGQPCDFDFETA